MNFVALMDYQNHIKGETWVKWDTMEIFLNIEYIFINSRHYCIKFTINNGIIKDFDYTP